MIRTLINIYIILIIIDAIVSYFPQVRHQLWAMKLRKVVDFTCAPIRRALPPGAPFDFSPLIVILILQLIKALW